MKTVVAALWFWDVEANSPLFCIVLRFVFTLVDGVLIFSDILLFVVKVKLVIHSILYVRVEPD